MAVKRRNGLVLLVTLVVSGWLTGLIYRSDEIAMLTYVLAAVLIAGTVLSGGMPKPHRRGRHPVVAPFLTGLLAFVLTWLAGAVVRLIPAFDHAIVDVLRKADRGSTVAIVLAAVVAGISEEAFYRGAMFERVRLPIPVTTVAHMLATIPAGNIALTCAAGMLGTICGLSRRTSGGWWAPAVVHATWSILCVAWLPR